MLKTRSRVGALEATVVLQDPSRVHYGSAEPVRGHVRLSYIPNTQQQQQQPAADRELFGPCKVHVALQGCLKVDVKPRIGSADLYPEHERVPLFAAAEACIFDGALRLTRDHAGLELPFELRLPAAIGEEEAGQFARKFAYHVQRQRGEQVRSRSAPATAALDDAVRAQAGGRRKQHHRQHQRQRHGRGWQRGDTGRRAVPGVVPARDARDRGGPEGRLRRRAHGRGQRPPGPGMPRRRGPLRATSGQPACARAARAERGRVRGRQGPRSRLAA
ncbi:uncharacterized protein B0I36DRAFT_355590 [Microdochium trichocladiopsis]|uniref:Uncharacterized protein n=1 Tax=Microdochium trichocladiopsis TaxID=1682393 RepID=A0A9P8XS16_9PEZI|nr:uncharacterized protein B0I36DRAFT_355590 [Microdochium trichocladiopsis]KAH7014364.1 hypothetical protein B0I36DRAFT_355590 [Microdochium trichocladiopsis]